MFFRKYAICILSSCCLLEDGCSSKTTAGIGDAAGQPDAPGGGPDVFVGDGSAAGTADVIEDAAGQPDASDGAPDIIVGDASAGTDPGPIDPWAEWDAKPRCTANANLQGTPLRQALHDLVKDHDALSYDSAREEMFMRLDNDNGRVQCVYTGQWLETAVVPDADVMNAEHTWCQSWDADSFPAKSDLHHLFPTFSDANSRRGSDPFGNVAVETWSSGGSRSGRDEWGRTVFEPRDPHKGDCARAMFYFAVRYERQIEKFMEDPLREWNRSDLPDGREAGRNDAIERLQTNCNPFVDCPQFVERIQDF